MFSNFVKERDTDIERSLEKIGSANRSNNLSFYNSANYVKQRITARNINRTYQDFVILKIPINYF